MSNIFPKKIFLAKHVGCRHIYPFFQQNSQGLFFSLAIFPLAPLCPHFELLIVGANLMFVVVVRSRENGLVGIEERERERERERVNEKE